MTSNEQRGLDAGTPAPSSHVMVTDRLRVAAEGVISSASDTYKKRNGHLASFEDDSGEKCWIVPFDAFEELRSALSSQPAPANQSVLGGWIDVNESLPGEQGHDSEDVSVFLNGHCGLLDHDKRNGGGWGYRTGFYDAAKQCFRVHGQLDRFVTHWQPLPAPPATATSEGGQ